MNDNKSGFWWCPECKEEVCPERVTYTEHHEDCGQIVIWKEQSQKPTAPVSITGPDGIGNATGTTIPKQAPEGLLEELINFYKSSIYNLWLNKRGADVLGGILSSYMEYNKNRPMKHGGKLF